MSVEDNITQQSDEIEAISAIYGDDFRVVDQCTGSYSITVSVEQLTLTLMVTLPSDYPSNSPPRYNLDGHWLMGPRKKQLTRQLEETYLEHVGECVLYQWVERVREFLLDLAEVEASGRHVADIISGERSRSASPPHFTPPCPPISSGELIIDRKSVFQPHLARVTSPDEVPVVLNSLKENRKIASATHNIFAYRIEQDNGVLAQDCEDDGETKAGSRMLHLMTVLNVVNVLVVVTRWYGGCHIGPDRFKHINTATRCILDQCGLIEEAEAATRCRKSNGGKGAGRKKKKHRSVGVGVAV